MTTFASDTFGSADGTELPTHNANWAKSGGSGLGIVVCDGSNRARDTNSTVGIYYRDEAPASADYSVQFDFIRLADEGNHGVYVAARVSTSAATLYIFGQSAGLSRVYRRVDGTYTQLGSTTNEALALDTAFLFKLAVETSGANCVLTCTIDGAARSGSPITDTSPITAAGKSGIFVQDATGNRRIANFSADEDGGFQPAWARQRSGIIGAGLY